MWTQVLYNYSVIDANSVIQVYTGSFVEAVILGICVHTTIGLGNLLEMRGLPILSSFLGIAVGCIFIKILGISQSFYLTGFVFISIIGILLMLKAVLPNLRVFTIKSLLLLIIESLLSVIMCGYVVALKMYSNGSIGISSLFSIIVICIVALLITFVVGMLVRKDEKR